MTLLGGAPLFPWSMAREVQDMALPWLWLKLEDLNLGLFVWLIGWLVVDGSALEVMD